MGLATRAAGIVQVADVPLVNTVLVDLACAVGIALVALERNKWNNFCFFWRWWCWVGRGGGGGGGVHAAVNDGPFALVLFRGSNWRVYSCVVKADATCVHILEFFFKCFSFSLVTVLGRFFNIFLQGSFATCSVIAHDGVVCKL